MPKRLFATILTLLMLLILQLNAFADDIPTAKINQIKTYIKTQMESGEIPGVAVVIVKGDKTVYENGFGYADIENKQPVTPQTLFEIGSNSKAFTALGILTLEHKGLIKLTDPVSKYIPWLKMKYKGQYVDVTIQQVLNQTSGMPFNSIGKIPEGNSDDMLLKTVKTLEGVELVNHPGEKFLYATINYDILGLIIQTVSGRPYEDYMQNNVLKPLGLNNTYLKAKLPASQTLAKGYRTSFMHAIEFKAPVYRGNTPAGYYITNVDDVGRWLKYQLGTQKPVEINSSLIEESHVTGITIRTTPSTLGYAMGWYTQQNKDGRQIFHAGENPNYTSYMILSPYDTIGVAVLTNTRSDYIPTITWDIFRIIMDKSIGNSPSDLNKSVDNITTIVIYVSIPLILLALWLIIAYIARFLKEKRAIARRGVKGFILPALLLIFIVALGIGLYSIPSILYPGLSWGFLNIWGPISFMIAVICVYTWVVLFVAYLLFRYFTSIRTK